MLKTRNTLDDFYDDPTTEETTYYPQVCEADEARVNAHSARVERVDNGAGRVDTSSVAPGSSEVDRFREERSALLKGRYTRW
ncbi:hypothetical protein KKC94_04110 [Patescibacteria group bacterium]|nr:hypothetical protein [Patescibacteria group bacterium]